MNNELLCTASPKMAVTRVMKARQKFSEKGCLA